MERVVIKYTGEALSCHRWCRVHKKGRETYCEGAIQFVVSELIEAFTTFRETKQMVVVIGGGNILRGSALRKRIAMPEVDAHFAGMSATITNGRVLRGALIGAGLEEVRLTCSLNAPQFGEHWIVERVLDYLNAGKLVIRVGGTGNPTYSTDAAAVLTAREIDAKRIFKATKVHGVYNVDPNKKLKRGKRLHMYKSIPHMTLVRKKLGIFDLDAVAKAATRPKINILVFNGFRQGHLLAALQEKGGSYTVIGDRRRS